MKKKVSKFAIYSPSGVTLDILGYLRSEQGKKVLREARESRRFIK